MGFRQNKNMIQRRGYLTAKIASARRGSTTQQKHTSIIVKIYEFGHAIVHAYMYVYVYVYLYA